MSHAMFGKIRPQTEIIIFLKYLLKSDIEIDHLKKSNSYQILKEGFRVYCKSYK